MKYYNPQAEIKERGIVRAGRKYPMAYTTHQGNYQMQIY